MESSMVWLTRSRKSSWLLVRACSKNWSHQMNSLPEIVTGQVHLRFLISSMDTNTDWEKKTYLIPTATVYLYTTKNRLLLSCLSWGFTMLTFQSPLISKAFMLSWRRWLLLYIAVSRVGASLNNTNLTPLSQESIEIYPPYLHNRHFLLLHSVTF